MISIPVHALCLLHVYTRIVAYTYIYIYHDHKACFFQAKRYSRRLHYLNSHVIPRSTISFVINMSAKDCINIYRERERERERLKSNGNFLLWNFITFPITRDYFVIKRFVKIPRNLISLIVHAAIAAVHFGIEIFARDSFNNFWNHICLSKLKNENLLRVKTTIWSNAR